MGMNIPNGRFVYNPRTKDFEWKDLNPLPKTPAPDQPKPTDGGNNGGNSGGNNGTCVKVEPTTNEVLDFMANSTIYNQVNIAKAKK